MCSTFKIQSRGIEEPPLFFWQVSIYPAGQILTADFIYEKFEMSWSTRWSRGEQQAGDVCVCVHVCGLDESSDRGSSEWYIVPCVSLTWPNSRSWGSVSGGSRVHMLFITSPYFEFHIVLKGVGNTPIWHFYARVGFCDGGYQWDGHVGSAVRPWRGELWSRQHAEIFPYVF